MAVYGTNADAVQAVISGRADANLAGLTPSAWAVKKDMSVVDLKLPEKKEFVHRINFRPDEQRKYDGLL